MPCLARADASAVQLMLSAGGPSVCSRACTQLVPDLLLQAAETQVKQLEEAQLGVDIGLLHGKFKGADKQEALTAFAEGRTPVLVATSVVEVRSLDARLRRADLS